MCADSSDSDSAAVALIFGASGIVRPNKFLYYMTI